jgi:hypothetical protein
MWELVNEIMAHRQDGGMCFCGASLVWMWVLVFKTSDMMAEA